MDSGVIKMGAKGGLVERRQRSSLERGVGALAGKVWGGGSRATKRRWGWLPDMKSGVSGKRRHYSVASWFVERSWPSEATCR